MNITNFLIQVVEDLYKRLSKKEEGEKKSLPNVLLKKESRTMKSATPANTPTIIATVLPTSSSFEESTISKEKSSGD